MRNVKALLIVMIGCFAFVANGQEVSLDGASIVINSLDPAIGPYYPLDEVDVNYSATGFPTGTQYSVIMDINGNNEYDDEDILLGSSTTASDVITITIPMSNYAIEEFNPGALYVIAGKAGDAGDRWDDFSVSADYSDLDDVFGESNGTFPATFDIGGGTNVRSATVGYDFSEDEDAADYNSQLQITLDASAVTTDNPIVVEYSVDNEETYTALTDVNGDDEFEGTNGGVIFDLPADVEESVVFFRISQPGSDTFAIATDKAWSLSELYIVRSTGDYVAYGSEQELTFDISAPSFSLTNEELADFVGEDFSVDYEAFGFSSDATFYYYYGEKDSVILDPETRVVYDNATASDGTLEGTWPLENANDLTDDLFVAGFYGNFEDPTYQFENSVVTVSGSNESDFTYTFDQNTTRSITTNAVDLSGEEYVTLVIGFGDVNQTNSQGDILLQYNTGSGWVTIDEIESFADDETLSYVLESAAISATSMFRLKQVGVALGSSQSWQVKSLEIQKYLFQGAIAQVSPVSIDNYLVNIDSVELANGDNIANSNQDFYPGDEISIYAHVEGFDPDGDNYTALLGGEYFLEDEDLTVNDDSTIVITGTITRDIVYDDDITLEIVKYEGTEAILGTDEDIFNDYDEDDLLIEGGDYEGSYVFFEQSGSRSFTTPEIEIASNSGLMVSFDLERENNVRSPEGTEIVLEFSTDGSTYTVIETFNLNEAAGGESFEVTEFVADVASNSTTFRWRQLSNNGFELDSWYLWNIQIEGASTLFTPDYLDYEPDYEIDVLAPEISLSEIPEASGDLFYDDAFSATLTIDNGALPDGTNFYLMLERDEPFDIILDTLTAAGTFSATVPAIVAGNYNVYVMVDFAGVANSNSVVLPVTGISINNIVISSDDAITEGESSFIYPASDLDISYTIVGDIEFTGVTLTLEVKDNDLSAPNDYVVLESGLAASASGTIETNLPIGYNYNGDPEFRLSLVNGNRETVVSVIDATWGSTVAGTSQDNFPLAMREGEYGSGDENIFGDTDGERYAESVEFDFSDASGAAVKFELDVDNYEEDDWVFFEYSIDEGDTWVAFDSVEFEGNGSFIEEYSDLPEEALTSATYLRFIYNTSSVVGSGDNEILFEGISLRMTELNAIAIADFSLSQDLQFENLSLSVSDLGDPDPEYSLGEEFVVEYNADGPFPSDVSFAVVLEGDQGYMVLDESTATGAAQVTVNFPSTVEELEEIDDDFDDYLIKVIPFYKSGDATYMNEAITTNLDEEDYFLAVDGRDASETSYAGTFTFNEAGDRSLLTSALDLTATDTVTLNFTFGYTGGTPSTFLTLPQLLVSTDGGTSFDTLSVGEDYSSYDGYLYEGAAISIGIPSEYLTEATHFMWAQALNRGAGETTWTLSGISIVEGETNEFPTSYYTQGPNVSQDVEYLQPDLNNYVWKQNVMTDPVFNGDTFDYLWTIDSTKINETEFPEGTVFTFSLDGVTDPDTNEDVIIGTTSEYGVSSASVPFYAKNGQYDIGFVATLTVDEVEYELMTADSVGTLDIFLKSITTIYEGDVTDVLYAGNSATFSIDVENDETDNASFDNLFATLLVKDFSGGEDLVLATQQGIADITVDLPPYVRGGSFEFRVELTEDVALGEVGDLVSENSFADLEIYETEFVSSAMTNYNFYESYLNGASYFRTRVDNRDGQQSVDLYYRVNGGAWVYFNTTPAGSNSYEYLNLDSTTPDMHDWYDNNANSNDRIEFKYEYATEDGISNFSVTELYFYSGGTATYDADSYIDYTTYSGVRQFPNDYGRGLITTRDFEVGELEGAALVTFDLTFDETLENLGPNQQLIFEYSIDEGVSYVQLDTFPTLDYYDDPEMQSNISDSFTYQLNDDIRGNATRFRFRQEERNGINVVISNFEFLSGESLPFEYVSSSVNVVNQAVLISSVSTDDACASEEIELSYEIRGKFDSDNVMSVYYSTGSGYTMLSGYEFEATEGTGTETVSIPTSIIEGLSNNTNIWFRLDYDNDGDDYMDVNGSGTPSERSVELIALIDQDAEFSFDDVLECEGGDVIVNVDDVQDYFMYEIINSADASVLGSLTYDPDLDDTEINIGTISETTELEMRITAMSSNGTTCSSYTSDYTDRLDYLPNYALYRETVNGSEYVLVGAGESYTVCEDATGILELSARRLVDASLSGAYGSVEWFRDDLSNPVSTDATLGDNEGFRVSGTYFARVTTSSCIYMTDSVEVEVLDAPDRPAITVVSGALTFCDGDGEVVLEAPAGFNHYMWSTGATTQSITVDEDGAYSVSVSNISFDLSCGSPYSEEVVVESISSPDFNVMNTSFYDEDNIIDEGSVIESCDNAYLYFFENTGYGNSGTVTVYSVADDGTETVYATTTGNNLEVTASGMYRADRFSSDVNATCVESTGVFEVVINDIPVGTPTLEVTGDLAFCTGEGSATLTAPAGFDYYQWYRNGGTINSNQSGFANTTNTITVAEGGIYSVKVGNAAGCYGRISNTIEIKERSLPSLPSLTQTDATCGEGVIEFRINSSSSSYSYQLINAETGLASGAPVKGNSSTTTYIYSDAVSEATPFYVEVTYFDGSGCVNFNEFSTYTGQPNNVHLELDGATIDAIISSYSGWQEIRWYRNGVELRNKTNSSSVTVLDNAEYMVEVDFEGTGGVCTVSSNAVSADGGGRTTLPDGASIVASTYPNPTTDVVNLEIPGEELGSVRVQIMTLSGQIVMDQTFEKNAEQFTQQINISTFETGIYNMTVSQGSKVENIRIVKQ
ncbi:T9SS type A sorting domain-containing protein [Marinoscillum pacificum]|uniref:T9SS type A sorting domain-containing protein n=1 Tax=Marinoscillum pacificum TaxID=392723 RepID=UPI0021578C0D|nr:T9SS type A sorting domain-containing protein [Marinoscillum pacificum]